MARLLHLALIGDAGPARQELADYLAELGYEVHCGRGASQAVSLFERQPMDLVVLQSPGGPDSGLADIWLLRDATPAPLLVVTPSRDLIDRITGLESGADDVLIAPVDPQELAARINNMLARCGLARRDVLRLERTAVDLVAARLLRAGHKPERLGPGEITLIRALTGNPHRVLSRDELMDLAPAESLEANDRSIDTRMARLRRKLDTDAIVTVRGHGYMYVPPFESPGR